MPAQKLPTERLQSLLHRRKCWTLAQLAQTLGYSPFSVRPFLKQIGYFRSSTQNGKWHTLRQTPQFDRDGLWRHKGIGFSKHVSLTATIAHLVGRSPAGLSASQLAQKLQHPCNPVLTHLHQDGQLDRVKVAGQFRYLAKEPQLNGPQRQQALLTQEPDPATSLSTQAAVWVLVRAYQKSRAELRATGRPSAGATKTAHYLRTHRSVLPRTRSKKNARSTELKTLTALQSFLEKLATESSTAALFVQRPLLYFRSAQTLVLRLSGPASG